MVRSIPYLVEGPFGVRRIDGEPAGAEHWGTYGGGGWLLRSGRGPSAPVGVLTVSVIKPTFGSATNAGPNGSYTRYS